MDLTLIKFPLAFSHLVGRYFLWIQGLSLELRGEDGHEVRL
jgi:hypothetical protein